MGLFRMAARTAVVAGTATAVSNRVSRRQYGRWADQEEQQQAEAQQQSAQAPPPPQAAEPDTDDMIAQLKELAKLKDAGVLTDEEFAAQKAKILNA
jgi:hypothetical protein